MLMKKYIFTIAFALLGITSSMASKADTLRIYTIDGKRIPNFNFEVSAIVTDISGESHEGVMSLPLGTKPTILTVNLQRPLLLLSRG